MNRIVVSALLLLIAATFLVLCAEGRRRGDERRRWTVKKDRQREQDKGPAEVDTPDEEDEHDEEAEESDSSDKLRDDDTPARRRPRWWHSHFSRNGAVHAALAERHERRRPAKEESSETGDKESKLERHLTLRNPKWLSRHLFRWPTVLQITHTHAKNYTAAKWYDGLNVCRTVKGQLPEKARVNGNAENDEGEIIGSPVRGVREGASTTACFETRRKRKCHTVYIDTDGKKYEQTKIERCCLGYKVQEEMCVRDDGEANDWETIVKQEGVTLFATALSQLGIKPFSKPEVTVFAPTDRAMEAYFKSLGLNVTSVTITPDSRVLVKKMEQLIRSHVHPELTYMDLSATGQILQTEHPNASLRIQHTRSTPTVNCANLVKSDIATMDGLLNVVDRVLQPVTLSLADSLSSDSRLTTFSEVLKSVFGQNLESIRSDGKPVTIFAPTNEAMAEFDRQTSGGLNSVCLERLLRQHIVPDIVCGSSLENKARLVSSTGRTLPIERTHSATTVAGSPIVDSDIVTLDGVIHVISKLIASKDNVVNLEQTLNTEKLTSFLELMNNAGMRLNEISNVTLLVPQTTELQKALERNSDSQDKHNDQASFINYHIIPGQLRTGDFTRQQLQTTLGVPVMLQTHISLFPIPGSTHTANCVRVIRKDVQACNAVIHVIEKALEPPSKTVYENIRTTPELKNFFAVLEQTSFAVLLDTITDDMYTMFAPNNEAMNKLKNVRLSTREEKEQFVARHVARGYKCCTSFTEKFSLPLEILFPFRQPVSTGLEHIVQCDSVSTNGVLHVINQAIIEQPHTADLFIAPPLLMFPFPRNFKGLSSKDRL